MAPPLRSRNNTMEYIMEKISKPGRLSTQAPSQGYNSSSRMIKTLIPIVISISLSACTSLMSRMPIDVSQREAIHESSELLASPHEIKVQRLETNNYYSATGGAIGIIASGLVNATIATSAEYQANKAIQPLLSDLKNYNFNNQFQQSVTTKLTNIKWLHLNRKQILKEPDKKQKDKLISSMDQIGDAFIYIELSHELSSLMDSMLITARVEIYKKEIKKPVLIYKNTFDYIDQLPRPPKSMKFINVWSANHGEKARKSMDKAIELLSSAIAKDISDPSVKPDNKKPTNVWYTTSTVNGAAYLEEKVGKKSIMRTSFGNIIIVNNVFVTPKYNWRE